MRKLNNLEIWTSNNAPDGSPIFDDEVCYAVKTENGYAFVIFDEEDLERLEPEDYDRATVKEIKR